MNRNLCKDGKLALVTYLIAGSFGYMYILQRDWKL